MNNQFNTLTITDFEKVTEPRFGFDVYVNDNEPVFVALSDLQEVDENATMFFNDYSYYNLEIQEMLDEAINQGVINLK